MWCPNVVSPSDQTVVDEIAICYLQVLLLLYILTNRVTAALLQEASRDLDQQWEYEERCRYSVRADGISTTAGGGIDYVGEYDSP